MRTTVRPKLGAGGQPVGQLILAPPLGRVALRHPYGLPAALGEPVAVRRASCSGSWPWRRLRSSCACAGAAAAAARKLCGPGGLALLRLLDPLPPLPAVAALPTDHIPCERVQCWLCSCACRRAWMADS
jgi:hypothetical protein